MSIITALPALAGPLAHVELDAELLSYGPAGLAEAMRSLNPDDHTPEAWRDHLAHCSALELSPSARAALVIATDRLQALLIAQQALEVAGAALAAELEREVG